MPILKYDLIEAYKQGIYPHPQKVVKDLGFSVLRYEGVPIADCIIIEVKENIDKLPRYLTIMDEYEFAE